MKFYFFTKGDKSIASSRYRAFYLAEELIQKGYPAVVYSVNDKKYFYKHLRLFISVKKGDVIYLQRTIYNKYFLLAAVMAKIFWRKKFIFDIDDAVFEHSFLKTLILTKLASAVTCGGHYVLEWCAKHNKNCFYFLNAIPPGVYSALPYEKREQNLPPLVGWIGDGPGHFENLKLLKPIFEKLIRNGVKFQFKLIGALGDQKIYDLFKSVSGLNFEIIDSLDWADPRNAVGEIQKFDIGVMPLAENPWNVAKYFKTLEYMACGVPAIAPNFGENKFIIEDGKNGFLPNNEDEWYEKIKLLVADKELRKRMREATLRTIESNFSLKKAVMKLITIAKAL